MISFSSATSIGAGIAIIAAGNVNAFTAARLPSFVRDSTTPSRPPSSRYFKDKEYAEGGDTLVVDVLVDNDTAAMVSNKPDTIDLISDAHRAPWTIATIPEAEDSSNQKILPSKSTEVGPTRSVHPLTYKEDIEPYLDIARPYYVSK